MYNVNLVTNQYDRPEFNKVRNILALDSLGLVCNCRNESRALIIRTAAQFLL